MCMKGIGGPNHSGMDCIHLLLRFSHISVHGFDEVRRPAYNHPLHRKVLKNFIYIYDVSISHYEVVPSLNHVIVVCFVSSC